MTVAASAGEKFSTMMLELEHFGEIMRMEKVACGSAPEAMRVIYYDIRAATAAKEKLGDRCTFEEQQGVRTLLMSTVKEADYQWSSSDVSGIENVAEKGMVVNFYDTRVAASVVKLADVNREAKEEAERMKAEKLASEPVKKATSDAIEAPPGLERQAPPGLDDKVKKDVLGPPPGLEYLSSAASEKGDDAEKQDVSESETSTIEPEEQVPSPASVASTPKKSVASAIAHAQALAEAHTKAVNNNYQHALQGQFHQHYDQYQVYQQHQEHAFHSAMEEYRSEVHSMETLKVEKPVAKLHMKLNDIRLSGISCKGIKSNMEHRTTICIKPLPVEMAQPGKLQQILESKGLQAVVKKVQMMRVRTKQFCFAVVEAANTEEVPKVVRAFHGRVFGNTMGTPPTSVTFSAGGADGVRSMTDNKLPLFKPLPLLKGEPRRITSVATMDDLPSKVECAIVKTVESLASMESSVGEQESSDIDSDDEAPVLPRQLSQWSRQLSPYYVKVGGY